MWGAFFLASKRKLGWKPNPVHCCFSRNIKQLEGTRQNLAIVPRLWSSTYCRVIIRWSKRVIRVKHDGKNLTFLKGDAEEREKASRCSPSVRGCHTAWKLTCHIMCVHQLSSEQRPQLRVQDQFGLRGGGSGGDPLSVMGQGHTMGALCQICWGCTAVGKGLALISVRMFTGVCRVWKLIRSLTFPSHNHLRISSLKKKKS